MATVYDIIGTINNQFTIGDGGITIHYGKYEPNEHVGKIGDIYIQTKYEILSGGSTEGAGYAWKNAYDTSHWFTKIIPTSSDEHFDIYDENGIYISNGYAAINNNTGTASLISYINPDNNEQLIANVRCSTHDVDMMTFYEKNYSSGNEDAEVIGENDVARIYYKNVINGIATWSFIKTYTFDNPIIFEKEVEVGSSNYKISIKKADNNAINKTSTALSDFILNHHAYGVVRFADNDEVLIDSVAELGSTTNKQIVMTPKQISDNINVEVTRATTVEGNLNDLNTTELDNSNIVSAIKSEYTKRIEADSKLQNQIDAIEARKDVFDVVGSVDMLTTEYISSSKITAEDIVKVLSDKTHSDRQTYYRYTTNKDEYAEYISIPNSNYVWGYVGSDAASYTQAEADARFVNVDEKETITGEITFTKPITIGTENNSGSINLIGENTSVKFNNISITENNNELEYDASLASTNATNVKTIATKGWVNDATKSLNVVHRNGNEIIDGTKIFTTNITIPETPINDTDATSKKYVDNGLSDKQDKLIDENTKAGTLLSNDGSNVTWRTISIEEMNNVNITNPVEGQTLVYTEDGKCWVNGLQTTATIKYW